MNLTKKHTYSLDLSYDELRVVGLALAGKWDKVRADAAKLNQRLLEARRRLALEELDLAEGALERAAESQDGPRSATPGQEHVGLDRPGEGHAGGRNPDSPLQRSDAMTDTPQGGR